MKSQPQKFIKSECFAALRSLPPAAIWIVILINPALAYDPLATEQSVSSSPPLDHGGERQLRETAKFQFASIYHLKRNRPGCALQPRPRRLPLPAQNSSATTGPLAATSPCSSNIPAATNRFVRNQPPREIPAAMRKAASGQNFTLRNQDVSAYSRSTGKMEQGARPCARRPPEPRPSRHVGPLLRRGNDASRQRTELPARSARSSPIRASRPRSSSAPASPPLGDVNKAFANVPLPWLLMTGTKDIANIGGSPIGAADIEARYAVYPRSPTGNKYELVLDGAEHSVFTDRALPGESGQRNPKHHPIILALSTAFWDAYLRGDAAAQAMARRRRSQIHPRRKRPLATQVNMHEQRNSSCTAQTTPQPPARRRRTSSQPHT